jgi:hypothetical protein
LDNVIADDVGVNKAMGAIMPPPSTTLRTGSDKLRANGKGVKRLGNPFVLSPVEARTTLRARDRNYREFISAK